MAQRSKNCLIFIYILAKYFCFTCIQALSFFFLVKEWITGDLCKKAVQSGSVVKIVLNFPAMSSGRVALSIFLPLSLFLSGLILRTQGLTFSSALVVTGGLWLSARCYVNGLRKIRKERRNLRPFSLPEEIIYGTGILFILFHQQYWFHIPFMSSGALFLLSVALIVKRFAKRSSEKLIIPVPWPLWLNATFMTLLLFLSLAGTVLNPRQFHNLFRSSTYEEYVRGRIPSISTDEAYELIHSCADTSESTREYVEEMMKLGQEAEKERRFEDALRFYNLGIDKHPFLSQAYYKRGRLKLYRLELNKGIAISSVTDFSEAIRLDSAQSEYYFQRGVALAYLVEKKRVCEDMFKAHSLDRSIDISHYIKKFCPSDSSAFSPANP